MALVKKSSMSTGAAKPAVFSAAAKSATPVTPKLKPSAGKQGARPSRHATASERIAAATEELASGLAQAAAATKQLGRSMEQVAGGAEEAAGAAQEQSSAIKAIVANLTVGQQNLSAADSQLVDVNMAQEMTTFSTDQILMQTGTSMLAQAQQAPSLVLKLI